MKRYKLVLVIFFAAVLILAFGGCASIPRPGTVAHVVLIKLKNNLTQEQLNKFTEDLLNTANEIPGVIEVIVGEKYRIPEWSSAHDYDYSYITVFKDKESLDAYYPHPYHSELLKKYDAFPSPMVLGLISMDIEAKILK
jgi:hypothetical protein